MQDSFVDLLKANTDAVLFHHNHRQHNFKHHRVYNHKEHHQQHDGLLHD